MYVDAGPSQSFYTILECVYGNLRPFGLNGIGEVGHRCRTFQFIQKVFERVEVRVTGVPPHKHVKQCLHGPRLMHRGIVTLEQERGFPKPLPKSYKHTIV